jgi:PAS domain-containing protein
MSLVNELIKGLLPENEQREVAVYGGGFKPPTSGHFAVVKEALKKNPNIDKFIILIGGKERDGISPDESLLIWGIYKKYLPISVEIQLSSKPPIQAVYNYAKNNPEELVLFVIGAREGNEEDFKDIASRTTSLDKYPNMRLETVITKGGVSGTAARNAAKISLEKFKPFVPSELSDEEVEEVYDIVSNKVQEILTENASYSENINLKREIAKLTKHMIDKGMNIQPLPKLVFKNGDSENAKQFLGKTAYYDPNSQSIVLYTEGRHPKDIVRSFSHEMVHHTQFLEDRLGDVSTTNTMEDDNIDKLEQEANLKGTMTFRNFTDSLQEKKNKDPFGLNAYARELAMGLEENKVMDYKIYVDMDGVVADFDQRFKDLSGIGPREFEEKYGKDAFWDFIDEGENKLKFWVGIPPMSDAKQLIDFVSNYDYEMLTAPSIKKQSLMGKGLWMINQTKNGLFPSKPKVNYKSAKNKKDFAAPNHILIDDREDTINSWNASGGIGILHTSASNTIGQLKKLGL